MQIEIITVGKLKEKYLVDGCAEYIKRIGKFSKIIVTEIQEERLPENPSKAEISICLEKESQKILSKINKKSAIYSLCVEGKLLSSEELSSSINKFSVEKSSNIQFIIGSSFGLSDKIKNISDIKLSFSKMTFPHQLMRMMLLEQTYRALSIINNGKYHK